jgi:hypothetical protein
VFDYNKHRLVTDVGIGLGRTLYSNSYEDEGSYTGGSPSAPDGSYPGDYYDYDYGYGYEEEKEEYESRFGFAVGIGYTHMFNKYIGLNCIKFNYVFPLEFQWMVGLHVAVPLFYNRKLGSFALYVAPNLGFGLDFESYDLTGFCLDIETGIALASRLHLAFVYNKLFINESRKYLVGARIGWHY